MRVTLEGFLLCFLFYEYSRFTSRSFRWDVLGARSFQSRKFLLGELEYGAFEGSLRYKERVEAGGQRQPYKAVARSSRQIYPP